MKGLRGARWGITIRRCHRLRDPELWLREGTSVRCACHLSRGVSIILQRWSASSLSCPPTCSWTARPAGRPRLPQTCPPAYVFFAVQSVRTWGARWQRSRIGLRRNRGAWRRVRCSALRRRRCSVHGEERQDGRHRGAARGIRTPGRVRTREVCHASWQEEFPSSCLHGPAVCVNTSLWLQVPRRTARRWHCAARLTTA